MDLLVLQHRAVQIEVDHMVVAGAMRVACGLQVLDQRLVAAGAQDLDLDGRAGLAQRFDQRARDRAVADIARAAGPRHHHQQVDRGRRAQRGLDGLRHQVLAQHRRLERESPRQVGIFERLPVQPLELRRAGDLEDHAADAGLERGLVVAVDIGVIAEDLLEQPLAVLGYAGRRRARPHLLGEREAQVLLEVPLQPGFLLVGERQADDDRVLALAVEADRGVRVARPAALADADQGHGPLLLRFPRCQWSVVRGPLLDSEAVRKGDLATRRRTNGTTNDEGTWAPSSSLVLGPSSR